MHYEDTVIRPLDKWRSRQGGTRKALPKELVIAQKAFTAVAPRQRQTPERIKHVSARLYIDKWIEHRQAYECLQAQQEFHGEGLKTLVRALLHYRDTVVRELTKDPIDDGKP